MLFYIYFWFRASRLGVGQLSEVAAVALFGHVVRQDLHIAFQELLVAAREGLVALLSLRAMEPN